MSETASRAPSQAAMDAYSRFDQRKPRAAWIPLRIRKPRRTDRIRGPIPRYYLGKGPLHSSLCQRPILVLTPQFTLRSHGSGPTYLRNRSPRLLRARIRRRCCRRRRRARGRACATLATTTGASTLSSSSSLRRRLRACAAARAAVCVWSVARE